MLGPLVGDPPDYALSDDEVPWVLGTHLNAESGPLARAPDGRRVLLVEAHDFARRKPFHHQKLTLVFGAMRAFRDRLEAAGHDVSYIKADTFGEGLAAFFARHPETTLVTMRPPSHGAETRLREVVDEAGGDLRVVENELFVSTRQAFDEWADEDGDSFRHENFYRWMRRESGVLMDGGDPEGGAWNFDEQNRAFPPDDWEAPPKPPLESRDDVAAVHEWVGEEFDVWGESAFAPGDESEGFVWPVTREGALARLEQFLDERLPEFGPYQDAMLAEEWAMAHALLSPAINLGLLHPVEVIEATEAAYGERDLPLNSVEGFIRQVLGWREFIRHVYRHTMPDLASASQLDVDRPLLEFYWNGDTDMNCLSETVDDVRARGYAHHIQRLMVLSNFATLWGVDPAELNDWFHATYVDAYHWVTTPNVVEMGSYGAGVFATKPYVASANYVDDMSDYCADCAYYKTKATGDDACPFNALYWDFLDRNEEPLRSNHRMSLMYSHVDDKRDSGEIDDIRARVAELREMAADSEL
ncbi:cryptochrome/photolyase family protein [Natronomonas sp.]|uniref:cryptochrome/photolyase family protein n=1 Tax=Natronomonas sp. TaxID=2184060 RepID=UPI002FC368DE